MRPWLRDVTSESNGESVDAVAFPPILEDCDVLCLSSIDWDFLWQGHQEVMSTFAGNGNRVLFVENTGVRPPRLDDLPRLRQRLRNWWRGTRGFREEATRLFVYSPLLLPFPYSRPARAFNRRFLLGALRRWMRATGFRPRVLWTFLPTPLTLDVVRDLEPDLIVYYCIDDLPHSSHPARHLAGSEQELFGLADLVFVTSEKLRAKAAWTSNNVHLFPFGVDFEKFDRVRRMPGGVPEEIAALEGPVAGYVGGVHQWIDQDLLVAVAAALPHVHFVLVGPLQVDVSRLRSCRNVLLLGPRSHDALPGIVKGFDVGLIPYRKSEYTANVYPTKLNEYLAMGLPVVSTDLPEVQRFNREYAEPVAVAVEPEAFAKAVTTAIDAAGRDVETRVGVARLNGWPARIGAMSELIRARLAARPAVDPSWRDRLESLYRRTRRRAVAFGAAALVAWFALFHSELPWIAAAPLKLQQRPVPADAIVVFGGGTGETGLAASGHQERVIQAVRLYKRGLAPRIVLVSGESFTLAETEVMAALARHAGVPDAALVLEPRGSSTLEFVRLTERFASEAGARRILLVSSPYHMRRAVSTFARQVPALEVVATPVPVSQFYAHDHGSASVAQVAGLAREYAALGWYWAQGHL